VRQIDPDYSRTKQLKSILVRPKITFSGAPKYSATLKRDVANMSQTGVGLPTI
jgi:hypothetical protein